MPDMSIQAGGEGRLPNPEGLKSEPVCSLRLDKSTQTGGEGGSPNPEGQIEPGSNSTEKQMNDTSVPEREGQGPGVPSSDGKSTKALKYAAGFGLATTIIGGGAFVAANIIVPGLGFAVGGILANSFAAGMMSSAAIANGGTIAAGSTVAILQSIGATGVAASACLGAGAATAAVGTAVVGATDYMLNGKKVADKETQTDDDNSINQLQKDGGEAGAGIPIGRSGKCVVADESTQTDDGKKFGLFESVD